MERYTSTLYLTLDDEAKSVRGMAVETTAESTEEAEKHFREFLDTAVNGKIRHTSISNVRKVDEPSDFDGLEQRAKEELHEHVEGLDDEEKKEFFTGGDEYETITEIADGLVPTYNDDVFDVAKSDTRCWEDSEGLAGGSGDVLDILRAAIYGALRSELFDEFERMKESWNEDNAEDVKECMYCGSQNEDKLTETEDDEIVCETCMETKHNKKDA